MRDGRTGRSTGGCAGASVGPVNPAYVFLGLLVAFILVTMWSATGDDPSGDAPTDGSPPAHGVRERADEVFIRALAVLVALVAGFLFYVAPEIALNTIWPDEPAQEVTLCIPSAAPPRAGDGPSVRASREAAAALEAQLRTEGFPDCPR
jgi:hypothetical protein